MPGYTIIENLLISLSRRMKDRTGPIAFLIYLAVRYLFAVMQVFPIDWNLRTARLLAHGWVRIMPRHYKRAVEHLTIALGDRYSPEEIRSIAMRSMESVTMFAVEAVCLPRLVNRFTWNRFVDLGAFRETLDLLMNHRSVILVTGHYGSFELTGHLLACLGFPVAAVMRPLDNVYLNRFIVASRRTHGLTLLDKKGAAAHAEEWLKEGALLGFIGDQDAGRKGVFVEFMGRPASTYKSIGLLAMTTQSPIAVGYVRREDDRARYSLRVRRIIRCKEWQDQEEPLKWITQEYTRAIESFVQEVPEQYLWIHRRWKSQPGTKRGRRSPV